jgi:hypothetical protein
MAATVILNTCIADIGDSHIFIINQCPWLIVQDIESSNMTSPMRLVSAVIIPAANDFGFW